jgi:hypothetical protein
MKLWKHYVENLDGEECAIWIEKDSADWLIDEVEDFVFKCSYSDWLKLDYLDNEYEEIFAVNANLYSQSVALEIFGEAYKSLVNGPEKSKPRKTSQKVVEEKSTEPSIDLLLLI